MKLLLNVYHNKVNLINYKLLIFNLKIYYLNNYIITYLHNYFIYDYVIKYTTIFERKYNPEKFLK